MTATEESATETVAFPQDRTCPYLPPPRYRELANQGPVSRVVLWDGREAWAVTSYALARQLLVDSRLSVDRRNPGFPARGAYVFGTGERSTPALVGADDPAHKIHRGMLISAFTIKRIVAMRPLIQEFTDRVLDAVIEKGPPAELVTDFAMPLPSMVMCQVLGVPYEDHDFFEEQITRLLGEQRPQGPMRELQAYIGDLIGKNQHRLSEGLFKDLATTPESRGMTREELVDLILVLLGAGHSTTSNMLSTTIYTLLRHPEQRAELQADPSLMPAAIEELLRYLSIADGMGRVATEDIEIAGITIREGDGVVFLTSVINRDESVHDRPDELDWHHSTREHIGFGFGAHQCLGQNLARVTMDIGLRSLFTRLPGLRLAAAPEDVPFKPGIAIQGMNELPVTW
ncbi:cytochrome P450 [Amycolatopsis sp. CA-126428]|uniref:cytochrome P450 n=1 Tax=Amycolatopsis sp. CA-126428 TaxID=2073158 RepID=UPI000CCFEB72|nr:cytochrome P450 [Amycolatopsis sp. CA-126428]